MHYCEVQSSCTAQPPGTYALDVLEEIKANDEASRL